MTEEDRMMIRLIALGDSDAVDQFITSWYPRISTWVAEKVSSEKVTDYAQEVMIHIWKNDWRNLLMCRALYEPEPSNPHRLAAFLKSLTRHRVYDLVRADRGQLPEEDIPVDEVDEIAPPVIDPAQVAADEQVLGIFYQWLEQQSDRDCGLLTLWHSGARDLDIAERLGMTPNNVRQRRFYLLGRMRNWLAEQLPDTFSDV